MNRRGHDVACHQLDPLFISRGMAEAHKTILCIEDDGETAALIAEELTDRGFDVVVAHDGHEGFVSILKIAPGLVLCDISLPIMSGFEVLERLSRIGAPPPAHSFCVPDGIGRPRQRVAGAASRSRRLRDQADRFRYVRDDR
jgi:CheY-like chemotaxis protein